MKAIIRPGYDCPETKVLIIGTKKKTIQTRISVKEMIIKKEDPTFGKMQNIKRRFFALRNGDIAAVLRKSGSPYRIIFGLQLPQIVEVASATGTDAEMAESLWANDSTRESRLMAPMVADRESFTPAGAKRWIASLMSVEETDILCHRLLRNLPFASELVEEFSADGNDEMRRYLALRLARNLVYAQPRLAEKVAREELARNAAMTKRLAAETLDEAEFILDGEENK